MTCGNRLGQLFSQFENGFNCKEHWLKDAEVTWRVRNDFLTKYPFATEPQSIGTRMREPNQARDFLHWIEVKLRAHGAINLNSDRPIREAANNVQTFRNALSVAVDDSRSLSSRIDDDVWAELPGFGRDKNRADRQIARKIVATFFPTETMPIFNTSHLEYFVDWLGRNKDAIAQAFWKKPYSGLSGGEKWELLSKTLIDSKAHHQTLASRDNVYFMQCLYVGASRPPTMPPSPCRQHPDVLAPSPADPIDDLYELETGIKKGQPYHNNKAARKAIELRAMELAKDYYAGKGWSVQDTAKISPYDLRCTRRGEELRVEVKGTTAEGSKVILTRNEVANAREFPSLSLFIVSGIQVTESDGGPVASGGRHREWKPWRVDAGQLDPLQYEYRPPA